MKRQGVTKVGLLLAVVVLVIGMSSDVMLAQPQSSIVERVIDGDTIELDTGEIVRYIGIDTPETVHPFKPVEFYGEEASEFNRQLVEGEGINLEYDVQKTDKYDRTLAYVYLTNGIFVNAELVKQGFARVSTYPPNVKYVDLFLSLEQEARAAGLGLWQNESTEDETICYPDVNCDGVVDIGDLVLVGVHFGKIVESVCTALADCEEEVGLLQADVQELETENAQLEAEVARLKKLCDPPDGIVYITKAGGKYHKLGCRYVKNKACVIPIDRDLAEKCGYGACSVCNP